MINDHKFLIPKDLRIENLFLYFQTSKIYLYKILKTLEN